MDEPKKHPGKIYCRINMDNGMRYIGQTIKSEAGRWLEHLSDVKHGSNTYFHNAIRSYGSDRFECAILEDNIPEEDLNDREIHYIKLWNTMAPNGYNLTAGGRNSSPSAETREKIRQSTLGEKNHQFGKRGKDSPNFGRKNTPETIQKMSDAQKGKKKSKEHIENMVIAQKKRSESPGYIHPRTGKSHSKETRQIISDKAKGRKHSKETRQKMSDSHQKRIKEPGYAGPMKGRSGDKNPMYGKTHTPEARKKISDAGKGREQSPETIRKANESRRKTREKKKALAMYMMALTLVYYNKSGGRVWPIAKTVMTSMNHSQDRK